jgi:hypothetical protein
MMVVDLQYQAWLARQRAARNGESLRRLNEGHAHNEALFAQNIWHSAVGSFDFLYAEYEVASYRDGSYFLDFAYIRPPYRIGLEIYDFSSHAKHVTRRSFDYNLERQNELILDGWLIFRISLDAIKERPRHCQQFLLQMLGKLYSGGSAEGAAALSLELREIMRLALRLQHPFRPEDVSLLLGVHVQYARKLLFQLVALEMLAPASGSARIRTYRLGPKAPRHL